MRISNIAALNTVLMLNQNANSLNTSLQRLSTGLRINSAKDDSSGLAISNQLRNSANTLAQATKNANDAAAMFQIADKAMDEQSKILDLIKSKATQAAQDGQSEKSRKMIQADINRLLEEFDNIANSTSYNNIPLLSGNFTNKTFQVGSQSNTSIKASIQATQSSKMGNTRFETSQNIIVGGYGAFNMNIKSSLSNQNHAISNLELGTNLGQGLGEVSNQINQISHLTGIRASYQVRAISTKSIIAGVTGSDFSINGVRIGQVDVRDNDSSASLISAINAVKNETGVEASISENGFLILDSRDGRGISIKDSSARIFGIAGLKTNGSAQTLTANFRPTSTGGVIINGENVEGATTVEDFVRNVNAIADRTGVVAKIEDGILMMVGLDQNKTLIISGAETTPNLGITTTAARGNFVPANTALIRNNRSSLAIVYENQAGQRITSPEIALEGKADGRYTLSDIATLINQNTFRTNISAYVENNNQGQARIVLVMPPDARTVIGMNTGGGAGAGNQGDAVTIGFPVGARAVDGVSLTQFFEEHGKLTLIGSTAGDIQIQTSLNNTVQNGFLGMDQDMTNFSQENISLQQFKGALNENQLNAIGASTEQGILSLKKAMALMDIADNALLNLNDIRADIGSVQQQLLVTINNISTTEISLLSSASLITDLDFATESANFAKSNILTQISSSMLNKTYKILEDTILSLLK